MHWYMETFRTFLMRCLHKRNETREGASGHASASSSPPPPFRRDKPLSTQTRAHCTFCLFSETAASKYGSNNQGGYKGNVRELADDVPGREILARVVLRVLQRRRTFSNPARAFPIGISENTKTHAILRGEDARARLDGTAELLGGLPHDLRKVRRLRVLRVVLGYIPTSTPNCQHIACIHSRRPQHLWWSSTLARIADTHTTRPPSS